MTPRHLLGRAALVSAALLGCSGALAACGSAASSGHASHAASSAAAKYGSLPTYLPSSAVRNDAPLTGSPADPAVTSEGDEVRAEVGGSLVSVRVDGPVVPGEGLPVQQQATTCTWTVTMHAGSRAVPVSVDQFNTLDHLGQIYRVTAVAGQPPVPTTLAAGASVTFEVRTVMPTGEGVMRWAPDREHIVGSWDFTVEND